MSELSVRLANFLKKSDFNSSEQVAIVASLLVAEELVRLPDQEYMIEFQQRFGLLVTMVLLGREVIE